LTGSVTYVMNAVLKIIKQDKNDIFLFTSLQSNTGKNIINELGIDISKIDSIVLYIPGGNYFIKSEAVFKIANEFQRSLENHSSI